MARAKSQVEKRREYVAEHPEEKTALAELQAATRPVLDASKQALAPLQPQGTTTSQLSDYTVAEAEEVIAGIDDRAELEAIAKSDSRKGVQAATKKRLAELEADAEGEE